MRTILGFIRRLLIAAFVYLAICAVLGFTLGLIAAATYNTFQDFI